MSLTRHILADLLRDFAQHIRRAAHPMTTVINCADLSAKERRRLQKFMREFQEYADKSNQIATNIDQVTINRD